MTMVLEQLLRTSVDISEVHQMIVDANFYQKLLVAGQL